MRDWRYKINVKKEWCDTKEDESKAFALVDKVLAEIKNIREKIEIEDVETLEHIVDELIDFKSEGIIDVDQFDDIWSELYDWCDDEGVWLSTII